MTCSVKAGRSTPQLHDAAGRVALDGVWLNWYDGRPLADAAPVDVDDLAPLAHPGQAGAWTWPAPRRVAFTDEVTTTATLPAVSVVQNQVNGATPVDAWQPADEASRCRHSAEWVTVKGARLTVSATGREGCRRSIATGPALEVAS